MEPMGFFPFLHEGSRDNLYKFKTRSYFTFFPFNKKKRLITQQFLCDDYILIFFFVFLLQFNGGNKIWHELYIKLVLFILKKYNRSEKFLSLFESWQMSEQYI